MRPPRCDQCWVTVDPDCMHFRHDLNCNRALDGFCRCAGLWVCPGCARCCDPSPLAAQLRAAHDEQTEGVA